MTPPEYLRKNFRIIRLIHKTDSTEIYLMIANAIDFICVLKVIDRIDLPYQKIQKLKNRNLPKIYYFAEHDKKNYILEEFLQGMTLKNYLAIEVCDCLQLLHNNGIIHRDIKPENLFFTNDECLKIIDFDASRLEKCEQDHDTAILGTEGYAAPEQYGFGQTDRRTDIYALGVTLNEILEENHSEFISSIIKKCMAFDPGLRFQNTEDISKALKFGQETNLKNILSRWL